MDAGAALTIMEFTDLHADPGQLDVCPRGGLTVQPELVTRQSALSSGLVHLIQGGEGVHNCRRR